MESNFRRSALEAVDCPWRYHAIYEAGLDDTSEPALRGQAFHDIMKVYIRRLATIGETSNPTELEAAIAVSLPIMKTPPQLIPEVVDLVRRHGEKFELDLDAYLNAEEKQHVEEMDAEFTPDLVYARGDELEIIDWKTFWVGFSEAQVKKQFQARVYVYLASKVWPGFSSYKFTFSFPRLGYAVSDTWQPFEVDEVKQEIESRVDLINHGRETGEWPAIPGSHCSFCRVECPIINQIGMTVGRVENDHMAATVGGELLVLEQAIKARKKALKGWCKTEGPVDVMGAVWGFVKRDHALYPVKDVLAILEEHELPASFDVSGSSLSTFLKTKTFSEVGEDLREIAVTKPRQSFVCRIPKDDDQGDE